MLVRSILIFIQPAMFLAICLSVYLYTGVGIILYIIAAVFFIIFSVVGISIMLRRGSARCVHVKDKNLVIERRWPWEPVVMTMDTVQIHHVGAKYYQIEGPDALISFDKSVCTCMSEEGFVALFEKKGSQRLERADKPI